MRLRKNVNALVIRVIEYLLHARQPKRDGLRSNYGNGIVTCPCCLRKGFNHVRRYQQRRDTGAIAKDGPTADERSFVRQAIPQIHDFRIIHLTNRADVEYP